MEENFYIITFNNVYEVLKAEKQINELGLNIKIIPLPSQISISCGQCIRINETLDRIKECLQAIDYLELYYVSKKFFIRSVKRVKV